MTENKKFTHDMHLGCTSRIAAQQARKACRRFDAKAWRGGSSEEALRLQVSFRHADAAIQWKQHVVDEWALFNNLLSRKVHMLHDARVLKNHHNLAAVFFQNSRVVV